MTLLVELLFQPLPHRDLRYERVVGQADWYTCGAAAVATLLTYYYGVTTSEAEVLQLAEGFMVAAGREPGQALTALSLRLTLEAKGIPTRGYRVTPEALADYFARGGLPVILHLTEPQKHFVVGVGMIGDHIVLADPSWGQSILPLLVFGTERGYSGVVLVPILPPELFFVVQERQRAALRRAEERLWALGRLREGLP
ncbi:MAG: cysteine peptidase family C39 domain-containing protein [Candidatus Bipolaricaulota bacterium]|nr:cysteine peptidase family C39 domain-containing protein [Candidatus Bipolaricaulota bacterium]